VNVFDADKTRMMWLPCSEKNYDSMLICFHLIPERDGQTDRWMDGRRELLYQYRASVQGRHLGGGLGVSGPPRFCDSFFHVNLNCDLT